MGCKPKIDRPKQFKTFRSLNAHFKITLKRRGYTIKSFCKRYKFDYNYFIKAKCYQFKGCSKFWFAVEDFILRFEKLRPVSKK